MPDQHVGPVVLDGVEFETWLLKFDKLGVCTSPRTREALRQRLQAVGSRPVILFSHGWNNEYADASKLYASFLKHLAAHLANHPLPGAAPPLFIGVIWPSTWFSWDTGPLIAGGTPVVSADQAAREAIAEGLPDAASRERLYALLDSPALGADDAKELAGLVAGSLAASVGVPQEGKEADAPDAESVLAGLGAMQGARQVGAASTDGDELGEGGTVETPTLAGPQSAGLLDLLDPRPVVRLASVYQMKDRAGTVGWSGVARLVEDILDHAQGPLHAVGHSYGCKVVLSAIAGAATSRRLRSVLLLQPAISHLSFAASIPGRDGGGGYCGVPAKVERTIITTFSGYDLPLHDVFHLALRRRGDLGELRIAAGPTAAGSPPSDYAALGGYGPRGADEDLREPLPDPGQAFPLPDGPAIIGLDGTRDRRIASHGDVASPSTAWLLHQQLTH